LESRCVHRGRHQVRRGLRRFRRDRRDGNRCCPRRHVAVSDLLAVAHVWRRAPRITSAPRGPAGAALVLFTVVDKRVAEKIRNLSAELGVPVVDVLGPLIANVAQHLHVEPKLKPGLLHGFSDQYFRRIEAVEFAVRHDDGMNMHTLFEADLVLTGPSRTSKTPLSMYLAQRGYKTGNV